MTFTKAVIIFFFAIGVRSQIWNDKSSENSDNKIQHQHKKGSFKRDGTCSFPNYPGMVAVQKQGKNAGWALNTDQQCSYGTWCPYACESGKLMAQWDPSVISYSYPGSQNGGLFCDSNGNLQKGFSDKDYCVDGKGTVSIKNEASGEVAVCQTVLPGNEDMLIPNSIDSGSEKVIAVPGPDYFAGTAAHYYINPPGVSTADACQWGKNSKPVGNWCAYVAGANQDSNGNTYVKIGWNPIYLEEATPFRTTKPTFGVKIECDDPSQCEGLPCAIDPGSMEVNQVSASSSSSSGAGGGNFCIVTAKNGAKAKIVVFEVGGGGNVKRNIAIEEEKKVETVTVTTTVTETLIRSHT